MNTLARLVLALCASGMTLLHTATANAAVIIHGTRFVYPAQDQEIVVRLENKGERPALIQVWLDDGDVRATPTNAKAPFTATPPISRLEPGKQQAIRLRYTGDPQATDRESLYWLNVLEVQPSAADSSERNLVELAFRNRLRLFFRPQGLPYANTTAASRLSWKLVSHNGQQALEVLNPTPYYLSLNAVDLVSKDQKQRYSKAPNLSADDSLLLPAGEIKRFVLPTLKSRPSGALSVEFTVINDFGGRVQHTASLTP